MRVFGSTATGLVVEPATTFERMIHRGPPGWRRNDQAVPLCVRGRGDPVRRSSIADCRSAIEVIAIFAVALALSTVATPLASAAQLAANQYRIGVLNAERFPPGADPRVPFFVKLRELGWVDGQNVLIKEVYADGDLHRLPSLAAELVNAGVDVIVAWGGTPPTLAAKQATQTIPIVFPSAGEPVEKGLVASLARPGGNVTGIANYAGMGSSSRS